MTLESLIGYVRAEKKPEEMLIFGFIIATIAILLSLWVFPSYASFAMVTFGVMAVLPLMVKIIRFEKEKQEKVEGWRRIIVHKRAIIFFLFLFLGFLFAYEFWFLILPIDVANNLFFLQINTITEINTPTGAAVFNISSLGSILVNNFRILALSVLFSLLFGSGAIFILVWNASVLGVAMASAVKLAVAASGSGSAAYFAAFSFSLIRFLLHGLPEITAYFLGGLAGGIISFTILDYKRGMKKLLKELPGSFKDVSILVLAAIILVIVSGLIEVFVTPLFIQ